MDLVAVRQSFGHIVGYGKHANMTIFILHIYITTCMNAGLNVVASYVCCECSIKFKRAENCCDAIYGMLLSMSCRQPFRCHFFCIWEAASLSLPSRFPIVIIKHWILPLIFCIFSHLLTYWFSFPFVFYFDSYHFERIRFPSNKKFSITVIYVADWWCQMFECKQVNSWTNERGRVNSFLYAYSIFPFLN